LSYNRILGANDRISLGHIGVGRRGKELAGIVAHLKANNVEMTAVCDLWKVNRERRRRRQPKTMDARPRAFQYMEDLLALKDVDAVLISTADFQHATHLKLVVEAGKDCYCEKPMANDLEEAKAARTPCSSATASCRSARNTAVRLIKWPSAIFIKTGALGEVSKGRDRLELSRPPLARPPGSRPTPRTGYGLAPLAAQKSPRPFDPRMYFEFRLYKDFPAALRISG
jgi:hypothetical protein